MLMKISQVAWVNGRLAPSHLQPTAATVHAKSISPSDSALEALHLSPLAGRLLAGVKAHTDIWEEIDKPPFRPRSPETNATGSEAKSRVATWLILVPLLQVRAMPQKKSASIDSAAL